MKSTDSHLILGAFVAMTLIVGGPAQAAWAAEGMTLARTDAGYLVTLDGTSCVRFSTPELAKCDPPRVEVSDVADGWRHVRMTWDVAEPVAQDELAIRFDLAIEPDFWWAPHLAPDDGYVIAQHVFRAPALIVQRGSLTLAVAPDLDAVGRRAGNPWFMDYDATQRKMWLGMTLADIPEHVLFKKSRGMTFAPGPVELSFFVAAYHDHGEVRNPWSKVARFQWLALGQQRAAPRASHCRRR